VGGARHLGGAGPQAPRPGLAVGRRHPSLGDDMNNPRVRLVLSISVRVLAGLVPSIALVASLAALS